MRRVADVRLRVRPDANRSGRAELEAGRGRAVRGNRGRGRGRRDVGQRRQTRRLRARAGAGGHALHGARPRGRRVLRHRGRGGRARHVAARRRPVEYAERAARQTGRSHIISAKRIRRNRKIRNGARPKTEGKRLSWIAVENDTAVSTSAEEVRDRGGRHGTNKWSGEKAQAVHILLITRIVVHRNIVRNRCVSPGARDVDDCRDDTSAFGQLDRLVLQVHDAQSQPDHVLGHQDVHRVQDKVGVREGTARAAPVERHTGVHRGRGQLLANE